MKSYILAVAFSMLLSAIYAFQNMADITVRFITFQRDVPQGVWEVILFSFGAVLMWFFSILASLENAKKYRGQIKERDAKITSLENEKTSLLNAFNHLPKVESAVLPDCACASAEPAPEEPADEKSAEQPEPTDAVSEESAGASGEANEAAEEGEKETVDV